ncbi:MAG: fasciclin domain-containing protein [Planctomycetota bacterium]|jgi:uncharacterized surface protein with fasciclin (FAS1) repeats
MKNWKFFGSLAVVVAVVAVVSMVAMGQAKKPDIVETAVKAGNFKTLVKALTAAELVETLKGEGPMTLLAPDDAAWAKLGQEKIDELLKPEKKDQLKDRLLNHVIKGKLTVADIQGMESVPTLGGGELPVVVKEGKLVSVGRVGITKADIEASNGLIHVIDAVIPIRRRAEGE